MIYITINRHKELKLIHEKQVNFHRKLLLDSLKISLKSKEGLLALAL